MMTQSSAVELRISLSIMFEKSNQISADLRWLCQESVANGATVMLAPLSSLVKDGPIDASVYEKAEKEFGISTERKDITGL